MKAVFAVLLWLAVVACAGAEAVLVENARDVTAMAALPDGGLLYGERKTGRILDLDGEVARVQVSSEGQRGLLGLAVDPKGTVYAAWTRPDERIVVGAVAPGRQRLIWIGPRSARLANGGHIERSPDGSLIIGIGDLQDPGRVSDRDSPHGKLLRLDPDGPPDQRPKAVSYGWNNPYAFGFTPSGDLWLADNAPGNGLERLVRADPTGHSTTLPERTAPSGLAAIDDETLAVCSYTTKRLLRYRITPTGVARLEGTIARDCRLGVVRVEDGRLAYSTGKSIRTVGPD